MRRSAVQNSLRLIFLLSYGALTFYLFHLSCLTFNRFSSLNSWVVTRKTSHYVSPFVVRFKILFFLLFMTLPLVSHPANPYHLFADVLQFHRAYGTRLEQRKKTLKFEFVLRREADEICLTLLPYMSFFWNVSCTSFFPLLPFDTIRRNEGIHESIKTKIPCMYYRYLIYVEYLALSGEQMDNYSHSLSFSVKF